MINLRQGKGWWLLLMVAVLMLAACDAGQEDGQAVGAEDAGPVVVSTVETLPEKPETPPTVAAPTVTPTVTPPAPLAALVNGQYIFMADYEQRISEYEAALLDQGVDLDSAEGQERLTQVRYDVLESLIDFALIEQGGAALGVTLGEDELEAQIESDIAAGGGQPAFEEWLQATGQTRESYKVMLGQSMLSQRVMEAVVGEVPAEVEQVHARHIMVDTPEAAQEVLTSLQAGSDFAALARERSFDLATKDNGGDLGWFPRGLVAPGLEEAAFALQAGEISAVVQFGEGYHVIQVVERETARPLSPEVQMHLGLAQFDQWLEEQRSAAAIERFVTE